MALARLDIANEFRAILAPDSIRTATPADALCGVQPLLVLEPESEQQLAAVLRLADDVGLAVIPRGGGTKLAWGNPPARADLILSTARLDKIIEHVWADLTVSVEAGSTVGALQTALGRHNQRLAIDPLWLGHATIGGILSTNDSGALRLRFGALRDLIIGVTIALPDGTLASSGGKVVKNVAGYDLPKLVTGAFGTLGVITRAVFRLHPVPRKTKTLTIAAGNLETAQRLILAVHDSQLAHTSLQLRVAHDSDPVLDILFEGTEEGIAAQEAQLRQVAGTAQVSEPSSAIWATTQELLNCNDAAAIAKITSLPANIASIVESVRRIASNHNASWRLTVQAIGIGSLRLDGSPRNLHAALSELRSSCESKGASLTVLRRPAAMPPVDTWGTFGDALPLMRVVKNKFDPKNTLNPGRFL
jgi:glycolate oxidase FAD binding subunit